MIGPRTQSPEELEREIARTRAEVDRTLAALTHRMSRDALMDWAIRSVRGRGRGLAAGVGRAVRDNPVPSLVLGAGLAWLVLESRRPARGPRPMDTGTARRGDPHRPPAMHSATAPRFGGATVTDGAHAAGGAGRAVRNA